MAGIPAKRRAAILAQPPRSGGSTPIVALGGGHGLSVSLRALRRLTASVTAVVGVADDGGSSGRLREELNVPPPGDLRMALAALCGDDAWGQTWSAVMQHRFGGDGPLAGHATGNLLIASLWEETGSLVAGLDWVAALLGAQGRVLPVATEPLDIVAEVVGVDPQTPEGITTIVGQVALERSRGTVLSVRVEPADPAACPEAVAAIQAAESVVLGPGSWYTSVLPHLLVPGVRDALAAATATRILVLNLDGVRSRNSDARTDSTQNISSARYIWSWAEQFPQVPLEVVLADPRFIDDVDGLQAACLAVGAELVLERVATNRSVKGQESPRHDAHLLAAALAGLVFRGNI